MGYRVSIDPDKCQGYACCVMTAPAIFDLDDEAGKASVIQPEPGDDLRDLVERAVRGCPAHAISTSEDLSPAPG
ncbi:MAG: ferredoxin [Acidimicrobiales bacterium]